MDGELIVVMGLTLAESKQPMLSPARPERVITPR
jgi:hypothetical protein